MSKNLFWQTAARDLPSAHCRTAFPSNRRDDDGLEMLASGGFRSAACLVAVILFVGCGLVHPVTAEEPAVPMACPTVDPPAVLVACDIDTKDQLILLSYHSIFIGFSGEAYNERLTQRVSLEGVQIRTAAGKTVTVEAARKIIAEKDTPILATSYQTQLPKFFAAMFAPETLHFAFPKRAPTWRQIESPGAIVK